VKIFHIVHWARSGIGVLLRDLIANRSPGVEHVVMCMAPGKPVSDQIRAGGGTVYEPLAPASWVASLAAMRRWTRVEIPDVLHSHSLSPRLVATFGMTGVPHMTTVHAAYLYFQQPGLRSLLKRSAECVSARRLTGPCVCVSEDVASSLPCKSMSSRAVVIVNGIDFGRARSETTPAPQHGDPMLVAIGRLDWEKRFDRLLLAIAEVRTTLPGIALVICGGGAQREALEAQARALGLSESITFTGHVADTTQYLRAADAFISSSVQEGFALSAVEAMASGCPVIATPAAGVGSILRDGETAVLAEGFESTDIATAIVRAFSDRERLSRIAEAGRRYAENNLDVRHAVSAYERIYHELCHEGSQSRLAHSST
jgi:glycosyltransferase involved in cell wall biosynthesis